MRLLLLCSTIVLGLCQTTAPDHLINLLKAVHNSHIYQHLPQREKITLIELISAAEVDQINHYIDSTGMVAILTSLDHMNRIDQREAHSLEELLIKELNQELRPTTTGLSPLKTSVRTTTLASIFTSKWVTVTRTLPATTLHN